MALTSSTRRYAVFLALALLSTVLTRGSHGAEPFVPPEINVPDGFEVSIAAAPPLVGYPMMACLDDLGRLYIAESDGRNLTSKAEIEKELPRFVRRLVDVDGDGVYDKSTIFADKMTMPEGGLWHNGALYIISPPYLWRLEDTDDDGVADKREKIIGYMEFDGRANQHGPYLGPNGRFYFSGGHFGYQFKGTDGSKTGTSRAAGVFSCWPDGSDVRIEGQGGINPVDIVFTGRGEMLSTCAIFDSYGGRHDALIHWLPGGLTQRVYGVPLVHETGYRLPAVSRWGQVAPAGLVRYRGEHFGKFYRDTLFACQFNTRRVVHVRLKSSGATFTTEEQDFLVSPSTDFHPADILEDADGSLLLLDTGGWLSWGCPHSKLAKPEVKGAVYRIRRRGGAVADDPLGGKINWSKMTNSSLAGLLGDARPKVRDRAGELLIKRGGHADTAVVAAFKDTASPQVRRCQLRVLSRISSNAALTMLRAALADSDAGVRQLAARSLGILKDKAAGVLLMGLLKDEDPAVVRAAATALGQVKEKAAVPALFTVLTAESELYLQHAGTRALIEIGEVAATVAYLEKPKNPHWQKTALRVLEQMKTDELVADMVVDLLTSAHAVVRDEAQRVISLRPEWQKEVRALFSKLLEARELDGQKAQMIESIMLTFAKNEAFMALVGGALSSETISAAVQVRLLAAVSFMESLPESLTGSVRSALGAASPDVRGEALAVVLRFGPEEVLADTVQEIAADTGELPQIRVAALESILKHAGGVNEKGFTFLVGLAGNPQTPALLGGQVARALGHLHLTADNRAQGLALSRLLAKASPLQVTGLLQPFIKLGEEAQEDLGDWLPADRNTLGIELAAALKVSPARSSLPASAMSAILRAFPPGLGESHAKLSVLAKAGKEKAGEREARLKSLLGSLPPGNASRGRVLFHTNRATCSLCHRVLGKGGTLGPDLSRIGAIRKRRDLLEAIIFPDATVVNGYENYVIETTGGGSHVGLIQRQTPEAVYLINAGQREQRVSRAKIKKMFRAPVSAMPVGLDQLLSQGQLADLVAFLESCQ
jgi:putative membrane-bound dehydrogenase-like protein